MSVDFFANGLCFYCHLAKGELIEYAKFHETTEHAWKQQGELLHEELKGLLKKYPEADQEDIVSSYGWDLHLNRYKYPSIHRSSLVISLYTFLDSQLSGLCETLIESMETSLRLQDFCGRGVEQELLFLSKVARFDLSRLTCLPLVKQANRLRNILVHAGGVLPTDPNDKLNTFVRDAVGLRGEPGKQVHIEPEFIHHLIDGLIKFFGELDGQVQIFMAHTQRNAQNDHARGSSA